MDRKDFTDVFTWAADLETENEEDYPIDDVDQSWNVDQDQLPLEQLRRYAHPDVAWTDQYDMQRKRGRFIATCNRCGKTFASTQDETARTRVQLHIIRHDKPPIPKYQLPDECPF